MQLPQSKLQSLYIDQIKKIEAGIKEATESEKDPESLLKLQKQLDVIAERYQYNEDIGSARYKLYELQALIYYFNNKDEEALDFIVQAVEMRGTNYARAEKIKSLVGSRQLTLKETQTTVSPGRQKHRKKLVGLEGWLALFIVGTGLGILLNVINLFGYGPTFNDLSSIQVEAPDYVAAMTSALWFEVLVNLLSIGTAIWVIVLLAQHKKIAKNIVISFLVVSSILVIIDYAWATSIFETFNVTQYVQEEMSSASGDVGRGILAALIWVPYFLVSKRVKMTLTQ